MKARIAWARHLQSCRICAAALRRQGSLCAQGASLGHAKVAAERLLADFRAEL